MTNWKLSPIRYWEGVPKHPKTRLQTHSTFSGSLGTGWGVRRGRGAVGDTDGVPSGRGAVEEVLQGQESHVDPVPGVQGLLRLLEHVDPSLHHRRTHPDADVVVAGPYMDG